MGEKGADPRLDRHDHRRDRTGASLRVDDRQPERLSYPCAGLVPAEANCRYCEARAWTPVLIQHKTATDHHTLHAFCRTIGPSALQWYASRNSGMLETTPLMRHFPGEWGSTVTSIRANSSLRFWHQTLAQPRKNCCLALKPSMDGGSFPARTFIRAM